LDVLLREFGALLPITGSWSYKIPPLPQDLLILAGSTMDLDSPVKLFRVKNGLNLPEDSLVWEPEVLLSIPHGEGKHHAEGITQFAPIAQHSSVLVVYDSPDETTLFDSAAGVIADVFLLD
jgi:hypothetical protein